MVKEDLSAADGHGIGRIYEFQFPGFEMSLRSINRVNLPGCYETTVVVLVDSLLCRKPCVASMLSPEPEHRNNADIGILSRSFPSVNRMNPLVVHVIYDVLSLWLWLTIAHADHAWLLCRHQILNTAITLTVVPSPRLICLPSWSGCAFRSSKPRSMMARRPG